MVRRSTIRITGASCACIVALAGCGDRAKLPIAASYGPAPQLPAPATPLIPTIKVAAAKGWPLGTMPTAAAGFKVEAFAAGLDHPRTLLLLPNGDVLVAETDAPPKPKDSASVKGFFMKLFMKKAGSGHPSANRLTLLRDNDGDGIADMRSVFVSGLNSPYGMALAGTELYVANTDALLRFHYRPGDTRNEDQGSPVAALPAGARNHHWTKSLAVSPDGATLFVGVGSNSNVAEHGMTEEAGRAAIWAVDARTGAHRIMASGVRNPTALAVQPETGKLWTVANERDELGSDIVPDYMTSVVEGGFYGWPYSYYGPHVDQRVKPARPDLVSRAIVPDYALGAHTASLGLAFGEMPGFGSGVFVGQHGSWNRNPPSGYKVVFVRFAEGKPVGEPIDVLTGFLSKRGDAYGRPVGLALDGRGGLLVADDVGGAIWRVSPAPTSSKPAI